MTRDVPEEVMDIAVGVAAELRSRYRMVDHADFMQEAWEWGARNPKRIKDYMEMDERDRNAVIATSLRNRLRRYGERQKAILHGYEPHDVVFYTADQIEKELLPAVFNPLSWSAPPKAEGDNEGRGRQDPAHGGNWVASLADCADAWRKLDRESREVLLLKFRDGWAQKRIAGEMQLTEPQVSVLVSRAVARILHLLGGERPEYIEDEVGRRRVISNGHAIAKTGQEYAGE